MKVLCSNSKLHEGLQLVGNVVTTSTTKPILQAIKLETVNDMLEISGTDLEVGMKCLVETEKVMKSGSVVLPGGRVMGLFREWTEGKVQLEVQDNSCRISGEGCDFKLLGYAPDEFPTIPSFTEKGHFEIDSGKVQLEVEDNSCRISGEGCDFKLLGYAPDEFPTIPSFTEKGHFEIDSG